MSSKRLTCHLTILDSGHRFGNAGSTSDIHHQKGEILRRIQSGHHGAALDSKIMIIMIGFADFSWLYQSHQSHQSTIINIKDFEATGSSEAVFLFLGTSIECRSGNP